METSFGPSHGVSGKKFTISFRRGWSAAPANPLLCIVSHAVSREGNKQRQRILPVLPPQTGRALFLPLLGPAVSGSRWLPIGRPSGTAAWTSVYRDLARWVVIAVPIGIVAGLGAALFYYLINLLTGTLLVQLAGLTLPSEGTSTLSQLTWSSLLSPDPHRPRAFGHGRARSGGDRLGRRSRGGGSRNRRDHPAFHGSAGKVRLRVPILKTIASAITLGTGGSGGREGPVSQIGGGFGSMWSDLVRLGARDRRIALATGMGAGIGAIFRAPLGGAVYSAEILYTGDFEPEVFVPRSSRRWWRTPSTPPFSASTPSSRLRPRSRATRSTPARLPLLRPPGNRLRCCRNFLRSDVPSNRRVVRIA